MGLFRPMVVIVLLVSCIFIAGIFFFACSTQSKQEKTVNLVISDVDYTIRQTHSAHGYSYVIDVHGKIKNAGDVDVKKVVVTAYCRSCTRAFTGQQWFTSDVEKTDNQKEVINYIPAGTEAAFKFEEVAFYFTYDQTPPAELPDKMDVVVSSYEPVE